MSFKTADLKHTENYRKTTKNRSSYSQVLYQKSFLKKFVKLAGNHL